MTEKFAQVEARIASVEQLAAVISAMRGIAAARNQEAARHLDGIRAYARTVGLAIGRVLDMFPKSRDRLSDKGTEGAHVVIVFVAEQGFAGPFSRRILAELGTLLARDGKGRRDIMLIGDRGMSEAIEAGLAINWSAPMIAATEQASRLANQIVEELFSRIDADGADRVSLVHAIPSASPELKIVTKALVPFDFDRFQAVRDENPPMLTLPPATLLRALVEEYLFAELCEAVILSFAAENEARARAMSAAQTNVGDTLDGLVARSRRLRQDEITEEITELAGNALLSR
jgi:F-type H+-transporting ATPase subunit gamma